MAIAKQQKLGETLNASKNNVKCTPRTFSVKCVAICHAQCQFEIINKLINSKRFIRVIIYQWR